jgi:hypothetical protein
VSDAQAGLNLRRRLTVQQRALRHLLLAEDHHELEQRLGVVVGVEEREALRQKGQQDDAGRPHVERWGRHTSARGPRMERTAASHTSSGRRI